MVLIISQDDERSTEDVINWLEFNNTPYIRLNNTSVLKFKKILIENDEYELVFEFDNKIINSSQIGNCWYRRGRLNFTFNYLEVKSDFEILLNEQLKIENSFIIKFFHDYFNSKKFSLGSIFDNDTNKISNLFYANKFGLRVPDTLITSNKLDLIYFINKHKNIITKSIGQAGLLYINNNKQLDGLTTVFNVKDLPNISNEFSPSLFQECIDKLFEIRVFYLNGTCYSSAIFSQNDPQTSVDFRNYNMEKPNRTPPIILPKDTSEKINNLMNYLKMKTGSIDIIVSKTYECFFLEINPIGQFHQVSHPCNYYLELKIAEYLSLN